VKHGLFPRFLKRAYRNEPISSFILTVGAVDAVMGGVGDRWALLTLGLGTVGVAIALRWWKLQQRPIEMPTQKPIYYLPSQSSRPLPPLQLPARKQPPK
jgi:hypothetical protein